MVISENTTDTTKISLFNFCNSGFTILASVIGGNTFIISNQSLGGGWNIAGTGNISNNKLRFNVTIYSLDNIKRFGTGINF